MWRSRVWSSDGAAQASTQASRSPTVMEELLERRCCVRGYHIYKEVWAAAVGEVLICEREPDNTLDRYTVAVKRKGTIVGHLPRKITRMCSLFLWRSGSITCTVTGHRRYSANLPQGGLEVPCSLLFKRNLQAKEDLENKFSATVNMIIKHDPFIIKLVMLHAWVQFVWR